LDIRANNHALIIGDQGSGNRYITFTTNANTGSLNSTNKIAWFGMNNNDKTFLFRNNKGNEMKFETEQLMNISITKVGGAASKINYIFEGNGNVRFYNKTLYPPSTTPDGVNPKLGVGVFASEDVRERLHVNGGIKIGEAESQVVIGGGLSSGLGGHIQWYNDSLRVWDGTYWNTLGYTKDFGSSGSSGTSGPTGGNMPSGVANNTMRYDGTNGWESSEVITNDGSNAGIGTGSTVALEERLEVNGGVKVGATTDTDLSNGGNIQWDGLDFLGNKGGSVSGDWVSLTEDGDGDASNELQSLEWNPINNELTISGMPGSSGTVNLSSLVSSGSQGVTGEQGLQGIQGVTGEQGLQGIQGLQGLTGEQGLQGIQGVTGEQGIPLIVNSLFIGFHSKDCNSFEASPSPSSVNETQSPLTLPPLFPKKSRPSHCILPPLLRSVSVVAPTLTPPLTSKRSSKATVDPVPMPALLPSFVITSLDSQPFVPS
jgi:hypothetical protein